MLALPLLVTTLALAPTGSTSRLELSASGEFDATTFNLPPGLISDALSVGGQAGVALSLFAKRVVDDDAPPGLQPFLQRTSQLQLDAGGGGFDLSPPISSALIPQHGSVAYADVSAFGYADRFLYASVALGIRYRNDERQMLTTYAIPIDAAVGARLGDARISLGWSVAPTRYNDDVFLARRFAVEAFVRGGHGRPSDFDYSYDHAGGGLSFEAWTSARLALAVTYAIDWWRYTPTNSDGENDYTNLIALSFRLRPR
jgi:hypothetical protein